MRILHVVPSYLPATRYGGPIYSVHALCAALAQQGHEVYVYTTNVDGPGVSPVPIGVPVDLDGVHVTYFPTSLGRRLYRSPSMGRALHEKMSSFDVAHLHSVFLWPTAAAAAAARRHGVPYVLAPRGMLVADLIQRKSRLIKSAWIALFERRNLAQAAAVHVTSDIEAADIRGLGFAVRRFAEIPNGIDLPPELAVNDQGSTWDSLPRPMILSLGRINWKKGLDRLIPAMVHVPGAHLVIAGNDEENYLPTLEALAVEYGVAERVQFVGPVHGAHKWGLMATADVFALPSYNENFGNAVLEAMAVGVPVVVTPEVGLAGAVRAAGAGLVAAGEPAIFGPALASVLADQELCRRMGALGRAAAREQFSWGSIARQTEALYRDLAIVREGVARQHA